MDEQEKDSGVTPEQGHEAFCTIVQYLRTTPVEDSEEHLRFCLSLRHDPRHKGAFTNKCIRDAVWMLRLHRATLSEGLDTLAKYGVTK